MHEYTGKDVRACLNGQRIVYIGDSTIRQLFWATAKKLNETAADEEMQEAGKHEDLTFEDDDLTVDFIWDPFLNSSSLRRELLSYLNDDTRDEADTLEPTGLVTVGGGLWYARHFGSDSLDRFRDALDYVAPLVAAKRTMESADYSFQSLQTRGGGSHVYLTPVQIPLYDVLSPSRASTMTPGKINPMNQYLYNLSTTMGLTVPWSHSLMTWGSEFAYEESGLHVIENVAIRRVDVILNMRCNAQMTFSKGYPFDRTCCSAYEKQNPYRTRLFLASMFIPPVLIGFWSYGSLFISSSLGFYRRGKSRIPVETLSTLDLFRAFTVLTMVLTCCVLSDRTQLFNKAQKHFTYQEFSGLCAVALVLGVTSVRRSTSRTPPGRRAWDSQQSADEPFLSRDQTDEWKGWMQFGILIYHYTGASTVFEIYQIIRILVASYLFMTGFGNTCFFYKRQDYSLPRSASVLVRLNLLSCTLPYIMDTDYLFYYFAPLVSFWYVVVYLTMRIGCRKNTSTSFLLGKIGISAAIVTILVRFPIFFDGLFLLLEHTCNIHWNVKEWRFRLQLDCYIVYVGMLVAVASCKISDTLNKQQFPPDNRATFIWRHWKKLRCLSIVVAVIVLPSFWSFTQLFSNKVDYNRWVPYVSLFPIISFIILRNCNRHLRNLYSSVFAWLGRCSLETFTLQFHIWLAADTKGLLSLGIFGRETAHIDGRRHDLVILTVVFFWVSGLTANAITTITNWIIDPKLKYVPDTELTPLPMTDGVHLGSFVDGKDRRKIFPAPFSKAVKRWCEVWMESIQIRLASIVFLMWILNMV